MAKGKKGNVVMILIPVVLAAAGLYFIFRKKKVDATVPAGGSGTVNNNGAVIPDKVVVGGNVVAVDFPLRRGSKGALVQALQTALMQYNTALPIGWNDGKFGVKTEGELFKVTKKKMVETQANLDSIRKGGQSLSAGRNARVVGVYSPIPIKVDPFNATKNI
jgi:preprotein translocase subunit YajC